MPGYNILKSPGKPTFASSSSSKPHGVTTRRQGVDLPAHGRAGRREPTVRRVDHVTAIDDPKGEYESIKRVTKVDADALHLTVNGDRPIALGVRKINVARTIRREDLRERNFLPAHLRQRRADRDPRQHGPRHVRGSTLCSQDHWGRRDCGDRSRRPSVARDRSRGRVRDPLRVWQRSDTGQHHQRCLQPGALTASRRRSQDRADDNLRRRYSAAYHRWVWRIITEGSQRHARRAGAKSTGRAGPPAVIRS